MKIAYYYYPRLINQKVELINNDRGFILVPTLMFVIILSILCLTVANLANSQARTAKFMQDRNGALYVAESGINAAIYKIENNKIDLTEEEEGVFTGTFSGGTDIFTDGSTFDVTITLEDNMYTITSIGKKNGRNRMVTIKAMAEENEDENNAGDEQDDKNVKLVINGSLTLNSAHAFQLKGKSSVYIGGSMTLNQESSIDIDHQSNFHIHGNVTNNSNSAYNIKNPSNSFVNFFIKGDLTFNNNSTINTDNIDNPNGRVNMFIKGALTCTSQSKIGTGLPDRFVFFLPNKNEIGNSLNHDIELWSAILKAGIYAPTSTINASQGSILGALTCKSMTWWGGTKSYDPLMAAITHNGNTVFPNNNSSNNGIITLGNSAPPFDVKFEIEPVPSMPDTPSNIENSGKIELNNGASLSLSAGDYRFNSITVNRGTLTITGPANVYVDNGIVVNNASIIQTENNVNFYIKKSVTLNGSSNMLVKKTGVVYIGGAMTLNSTAKFIYEGAYNDSNNGSGDENNNEERIIRLGNISWEEE